MIYRFFYCPNCSASKGKLLKNFVDNISGWLKNIFPFGTENGEGQLKIAD